MRLMLVAFTMGLLVLGCPKSGPPSEGVPVSIHVVDEAGRPVSTAVVRNPGEKERHRVSTVTGIWLDDRLHLPGMTVLFDKGMPLVFEVTAPGYVTETVHLVVRRRDNLVEVVLTELALDNEDAPEPQIRFGRDVPLDGVPVEEDAPPGS